MVARGEVWWFEHPARKRRPHVILTRDGVIPRLPRVLAAPVTRRARGIPTEIYLDRSDGMPFECVVNLDNVAVIQTSLCTERITRLGPAQMMAICIALRRAIAC